MYSAIKGLATASRKNINPIPEKRLVFAAVLTTPSPGNSDTPSRFFLVSPPFAKADAYRFAEVRNGEASCDGERLRDAHLQQVWDGDLLVATFRKAKRYRDPSMNVVAGPSAANCAADPAAPTAPALALRPMKLVSTSERRGPLIQSARHGK